MACLPGEAAAQEAVRFGAWRAYCAPVAGCVLGVKSGTGDTLAFVEPSSGDGRLVLVLAETVAEGAELVISFDGRGPVTVGAETGWWTVDGPSGPMVRIADDTVREHLSGPMLRRFEMTVSYRAAEGLPRRVTFALNGYADTRGYADDE